MAILNNILTKFKNVGAKASTASRAPKPVVQSKAPTKATVKGASTAKPVYQSFETKAGLAQKAAYKPAPQPVGLQNLANPSPQGGQSYSDAPMESGPSNDGYDFDAIINPVLEGLSQTESDAQSLYGQQEGDITAGKQTSLDRLSQTQKAQKGILDAGATRQTQEGESAADEARRQFAEVQQGLQGRYGGTTGTGAFAAEMAGRDTLGRIANIRQTVSAALAEIDDKKVQIEELGRIAAEDIDNDARNSVTQAREQLNSVLASIRGQRGELASRKAEMAMNAMQEFRALKAQVDARNTAFKQQLYMNQQAAAEKLANAQQRAQGIAESFKLYDARDAAGNSQTIRYGNQGTVQDIYGQPTEFSPTTLSGIGNSVSDEKEQGGTLDDRIEELLNKK